MHVLRGLGLPVTIFDLTRLYGLCCGMEGEEKVRPDAGPGGVET